MNSPTPEPQGLFVHDGLAGMVLRLNLPAMGENLRTHWVEADGIWGSYTDDDLPLYKPGGKELCIALGHKTVSAGELRVKGLDWNTYAAGGISMCLCSLEAVQKQIALLAGKALPKKKTKKNDFRFDLASFREAFRERYGATEKQLDRMTPTELLTLAERSTQDQIIAKKTERALLLAAYKGTHPKVSDLQIYEARNRPASKPEWRKWKNGILRDDSRTSLKIEQFLKDRTRPVSPAPANTW